MADAKSKCSLGQDEWPRPDDDGWNASLVPGDLLEPGGLAASWAPPTQKGVRIAYGYALAWLAAREPLDLTRSAIPRVMELAREYEAYLRGRYASGTVAIFLAYLAMAARAIAPDDDWSWFRPIVARAWRRSRPTRDKRSRLQATDDLLDFGMRLMETSERSPGICTWRRATDYRDGLMIALLALRPLRRRNFCSIEINRHLIEQNGRYMLLFPWNETKPRQPLEMIFPRELTAALVRYLTYYRPWLCRRTGGRDPRYPFQPAEQRLWVSKTGSAFSAQSFYMAVRDRTAAHFGKSLYPHLFRDCAATSIATGDPEHVRIIMTVLGHSTMRPSERHYNHARGVQAIRKVQDHFLGLRRRGEANRRGRGRLPTAPEH